MLIVPIPTITIVHGWKNMWANKGGIGIGAGAAGAMMFRGIV
jgi:hypothetical protein